MARMVAEQGPCAITDKVGVRSSSDRRPRAPQNLTLMADHRIYEIDGAVVMLRGNVRHSDDEGCPNTYTSKAVDCAPGETRTNPAVQDRRPSGFENQAGCGAMGQQAAITIHDSSLGGANASSSAQYPTLGPYRPGVRRDWAHERDFEFQRRLCDTFLQRRLDRESDAAIEERG
jgi:hypothetical protein